MIGYAHIVGPYRYWLARSWNNECARMVWVMLNPSTADANRDDPTIRKCIGFAMNAGYGGIDVVNLFAYRTTYPHELRRFSDPVGPDNDYWIQKVVSDGRCGQVIAAWGCDPQTWKRQVLTERPRKVLDLISRYRIPYCLGLTAKGDPRHPSRLAYSTRFEMLHQAIGEIDD